MIDFSKIVRAYDVRGVYPTQIYEEAAAALARGYVEFLKPKTVALGKDVRTSGPALWKAVADELTQSGVDVVDIGMISTDMLYFAVGKYGYDGGIAITASHNPREYNGMKFVGKEAQAISGDTGLKEIGKLATGLSRAKSRGNRFIPSEVEGQLATSKKKGTIIKKNIFKDYLTHIRSFGDLTNLPPLKIIANGNFGMSGNVAQALLKDTPIELMLLNGKPDGTFPKGRPDPLIPANREEIIAAIKKHKADLGVAWDADADRVFFYDEDAIPIEGYYTTALLAQLLLRGQPKGEKVLHDPRLTWVVQEVTQEAGGIPIETKTGHGFIKDRMRAENALFAGEMSGHYYFRDNYYCDNGMIPFVLILTELVKTGKTISELYAPLLKRSIISGELNFTLSDSQKLFQYLQELYSPLRQTHIDGLSVEHAKWRFNIRSSNTEPLIRLNVEARIAADMEHVRDDLITILKKFGAEPAQ